MDTSPARRSTIFPGLQSWWWVTVAASIFATTAAAGMVSKSFGPVSPELGLDIALSHGRNSALTGLSEAIHYGLGPVGAVTLVLVICLYLLGVRRNPVQAVAFGSVVAAGWLASSAVKALVGRSRPPGDVTASLVVETGHNSFPSGHTAFVVSLVLAAVLVLARSKGQRLAALVAGSLFAAVVAFSRLYLGVHYLSDVVGSVFISTAAVLAWSPVWNTLIAPRIGRVQLIRKLDRTATDRTRG